MAGMLLRSACVVLLTVSCIDAASAQSLARPTWTQGDTWRYRISLLPAANRGGTFTYDGTVVVKDRQPDRYNVNFGSYYGNAATGADRTVRYSLDLNRTALAYKGGATRHGSMAVADRREVGISLSSARRAEHLDLGGRSSRVGKGDRPAGTFDTVHLTGIAKRRVRQTRTCGTRRTSSVKSA